MRRLRGSSSRLPPPINNPLAEIGRRFGECFPMEERGERRLKLLSPSPSLPPPPPQRRTIGREAEYPCVWADGSAADVRLLLGKVAEDNPGQFIPRHEGGFDRLLSASDTTQLVGLVGVGSEYSLEVGWGTVEVITGPSNDLHELAANHERAMTRLAASAQKIGIRILGYGIQPRTAPSHNLQSPRSRYSAMLEVVGSPWLWFTVTASDQIHVDVSRPELAQTLNVCNALAPLVVGLCGNSPIHSGTPSEFCSAREGMMGGIQQNFHRHGMPHAPVKSIEHFVRRIARLPFLMRPDAISGLWRPVNDPESGGPQPFAKHLQAGNGDLDWSAFLAHEHYIWHSARPRCKSATIELRSACQQPWRDHNCVAALSLGMVEAAPEIEAFLEAELGMELTNGAWQRLMQLHWQVTKHGLAEPENHGGGAPVRSENELDELAASLVGAASAGDSSALTRLLSDGMGFTESDPDSDNDDDDERAMGEGAATAAAAAHHPRRPSPELSLEEATFLVKAALAAVSGDQAETKTIVKSALRAADAAERGLANEEVNLPVLFSGLLDRCRRGLERRGLGEETYIDPLVGRLENRENPAQQALRIAEEGGMGKLVDHLSMTEI